MANHLPQPPDLTPARLLREALAQSRAQGLDFEVAWHRAMADCPHSWREIAAWSRHEWETCYERRPATRGEAALDFLDAG